MKRLQSLVKKKEQSCEDESYACFGCSWVSFKLDLLFSWSPIEQSSPSRRPSTEGLKIKERRKKDDSRERAAV
jgi:hypothetical protein